MRIVFMGTPDFAAASLQALLDAGHDIAAVVTRADKPANRGHKMQKPPVKILAEEYNIPVLQPSSMRTAEIEAELRSYDPDILVVVAYGRILPKNILTLAPHGSINVHASILPLYRGPAPVQSALLNGDAETGVTIMHMAKELDAGDIIDQVTTPIDPDEFVEQVHDRLAQLGGELLVKVVADIAAGTAKRTPQDPAQVTFAPMLSRELCPIDWTQSAKRIHDKVRGLVPWPATSTDCFTAEPVKVFRVTETGVSTDKEPGTVVSAGKDGIDVACGDGKVLRILELQAPGSRRMAAADYLRGHPIG